MKKIACIFILLFASSIFASSNFAYLLGMRNNRYVFIGVEYDNVWGFIVENSVFTQGTEKQYIRVAPYYAWALPGNITGSYTLYTGMRYDKDYYDFGARIDALWAPIQYMQLGGAFNPFYDSFLKEKIGYEFFLQSYITKELGIFAGFKNIPYFRDTERRIMGGFTIKTGNILVRPELSLPPNNGSHLSRVSLYFIYKNLF